MREERFKFGQRSTNRCAFPSSALRARTLGPSWPSPLRAAPPCTSAALPKCLPAGEGKRELHRFDLALHVRVRIDHLAVEPDLEMTVWPGRTPGRTDLGDDLAELHAFADLDQVRRIVRIARHVAVAVIDLDDMAITGFVADERDDTRGDRLDVAAHLGVKIQAEVRF